VPMLSSSSPSSTTIRWCSSRARYCSDIGAISSGGGPDVMDPISGPTDAISSLRCPQQISPQQCIYGVSDCRIRVRATLNTHRRRIVNRLAVADVLAVKSPARGGC
jgi:hypothetical protein